MISELFLIISFFVNIGLGILVFTRPSPPYKKINSIFAFLCLASALWVLCVLMIFVSRDTDWKLFWVRSVFATSSFIPAIFLHFSLIFPNYQRNINFLRQLFLYIPPLLFLALSQTESIAKSIIQMEPYIIQYGGMHKVLSVYFIAYIGLGLFSLLRTYRNSIGIYRLQIKYCFLGMLITSISALITNLFLPILGTSKYSGIGPSFTMIMVGFITYSIAKHRLMDINIVLKKGTTFVLLLLLLFLPSFLLIVLSQKG